MSRSRRRPPRARCMAAAPPDGLQATDALVVEKRPSDAQSPNLGHEPNLQQGLCCRGALDTSSVSICGVITPRLWTVSYSAASGLARPGRARCHGRFVVTACLGGVIRDVLAGEPTIVVMPDLYVTPAAFAAAAMLHLSPRAWHRLAPPRLRSCSALDCAGSRLSGTSRFRPIRDEQAR